MIVVLSGPMTVGKSTAAIYLALEYGYVELAFANHLKYLISKFYAVDKKLLYAGIKTPEIREQLQSTADLIKFLRGEDYFIKYLLGELDHCLVLNPNVVISDARYFEELQALEEFGAHIVRIERPGLNTDGKLHQHESECSAFGYWEMRRQAGRDAVIVNDGTKEDLYKKIDDWLESIS